MRGKAAGVFAAAGMAVAAARETGCLPVRQLTRMFWLSDNGFDDVTTNVDTTLSAKEYRKKFPKAMDYRQADSRAASKMKDYVEDAMEEGSRFTLRRVQKAGQCADVLQWTDTAGTSAGWTKFFEGAPLAAGGVSQAGALIYDLHTPARLVDSHDTKSNPDFRPGSRRYIVSMNRPASEFFGNFDVPDSKDLAPMCDVRPTAASLQRLLFERDTRLFILVHNKDHLQGYLTARGARTTNDMISIVGPPDATYDSAEDLGDALGEALLEELKCFSEDGAPVPRAAVGDSDEGTSSDNVVIDEGGNAPAPPADEHPPTNETSGGDAATAGVAAAGGIAGLAALAGGTYFLGRRKAGAPTTFNPDDEGDYGVGDEDAATSPVQVNNGEFLDE